MKPKTLKILKWIVLIIFLLSFFICATNLAISQTCYRYCIIVDLKHLALSLKDLANFQIIKTYPIAGPRSLRYLEPLPKIGEIGEITFNPYWVPTYNTRKSYFEKYKIELPDIIPPNDPRNAMGTVAMVLVFKGIPTIYRIHGTNEPNSIGKRASSGCIRMRNKDAEELAEIILNHKTKVIIFYEKFPVE